VLSMLGKIAPRLSGEPRP